VEGPLAGPRAEEAGILAGEALLEVDFYRADLLSAADVAALLRVPASSGALLRLRAADGAERELYVERRPLPQPAVREVRAGPLLPFDRLLQSGSKGGAAAAVCPARVRPH